ncbi:hypothetical protein [Dysgonomonas sp. 520]|uniref:hypothetical protein n=1 Tax=Dysgonomonas sp. 520 TaxID=2302931 RepID=UPI0013D67FAE|nr:hypothetical protein [Dysgonomonas sp. 520]NDW09759.1 hypothetical protein [Dysgonomonas sp. 520]
MKKLTFLLFSVFSFLVPCAQTQLPYKTLAALNYDTTAFVVYNFMDRADLYKGKTLEDISNDLQMPIKDVDYNINSETGNIQGMYLYVYSRRHLARLISNNSDYSIIYVLFSNEMKWNDDIMKSKRKKREWNKNTFEYYKNGTIKDVKVLIPKSSRYYEKYKDLEKNLLPLYEISGDTIYYNINRFR